MSLTERGREEARRNLELYLADYVHVTRPALKRSPERAPAAGDAAHRLIVYDDAVSGWLEKTVGRERLSGAELAELRVDAGIDGDLDTLEAGGTVDSEIMIELRSAKLALDRMVYLARIAQGIEGDTL